MINKKIASDTDSLCREFSNASPFKHISIDNFLEDRYINNLCEDFPKFDKSKAKNAVSSTSFQKLSNYEKERGFKESVLSKSEKKKDTFFFSWTKKRLVKNYR